MFRHLYPQHACHPLREAAGLFFILSRNSIRNNIVRITMGEYAISDFLFLCSYCLILFKNCATLTLEGTLPFCIPIWGTTIAGVPSTLEGTFRTSCACIPFGMLADGMFLAYRRDASSLDGAFYASHTCIPVWGICVGDMFLNMSIETVSSIFIIKKRKALHCLSSQKQFSHYRFRTYTEGHYWHDV